MPKSSKTSSWHRATRRKAAPAGYAGSTWGGGPLYSDAFHTRRGPTPYELIEAYKSIIYFCARINSKAVSSCPLRLYVTTGSGERGPKSWAGAREVPRKRLEWLKTLPYLTKTLSAASELEEVTNHPILDALHYQNEFMDYMQWLQYTCEQMDLIGSAYTLPVFARLGKGEVPTEFWSLPAQSIFPVPDGTTLVPKGYQYFEKFYEPGELIRFRFLSQRNPYMDGTSPARAAIQYARLEDEFVSVQDALLSNGPRPNVLISPKDPNASYGEAERRRLRNEVLGSHRGGRSGGVAIADGSVNVEPLTWQPADLGAIGISEYDLERTANCFDIPPPFFSKETNLANMLAARALHASNGVEPRCKTIASTLTRFFKGRDAGKRLGWDRLFFAFDPAVREDEEQAARVMDLKLKNGSITINQANADTGFPDVPWGDEPWLNTSLIQPAMVEEKQRMEREALKLQQTAAAAKPKEEKPKPKKETGS